MTLFRGDVRGGRRHTAQEAEYYGPSQLANYAGIVADGASPGEFDLAAASSPRRMDGEG